MDIVKSIQGILGIENDTVWTLVCTIVCTMIPLIVQQWNEREELFPDRHWEVKVKVRGKWFYPVVLCYGIIMVFPVALVYIMVNRIAVIIKVAEGSILCIERVLITITIILSIYLLNKNKTVKKRKLKHTRVKNFIIIDLPTIIMAVIYYMALYDMKGMEGFFFILFIGFIIIEVIGLKIFGAEGIEYENSYADVVYSEGKIEEADVDKMYKRGKWLIAKSDEEKVIIKFEKITSVRYYGPSKYIEL